MNYKGLIRHIIGCIIGGGGGGVEGRSEAKFEQQLHICNFIDLDIIGVSASLKYRIRWYKVRAKKKENSFSI